MKIPGGNFFGRRDDAHMMAIAAIKRSTPW